MLIAKIGNIIRDNTKCRFILQTLLQSCHRLSSLLVKIHFDKGCKQLALPLIYRVMTTLLMGCYP